MKRVLSLLVAFTLFETQAWALSGGPFQNTASGPDIIGTYAGVLIPQSFGALPTLNNAGLPRATAIGLFSFAQDQIGFAAGVMIAFVDGTPIIGTITGLIDPEDGRFQAVIDAQSTYNVLFDFNGDGVIDLTTPIQVTGNVDAQIEGTQSGSFGSGTSFANTSRFPGLNASRISGTAGLDIFLFVENDGTPSVDQTVFFEVEGFKQSTDVTVATLPQFAPPAGGGGGGGGGGTP